ncbi:MAG: acetoin utilization protein AcuC [Nitrososphaerales archaeon]
MLGIAYGKESDLYSFPGGHPLNKGRAVEFASLLKEPSKQVSILRPVQANPKDVLTFHTKEYVDSVRESSKLGEGYLDYGDTPSFLGVYDASLYTVGGSLLGLDMINEEKVNHFFNPIGGLHHARRERAGGFCVFNDSAVAISKSLEVLKRVAYIDIDAHHGDGVYYGFEDDPRVIIGDIHEDGKFLYPGTGAASETGRGKAEGTKLNIPLAPGSGDEEFASAFDRIEKFLSRFNPEFIFFQCGADGLEGDPLTHLRYTSTSHAYAAKRLHEISHNVCGGRILAMGGGGYNPKNVRSAWGAVVQELTSSP